jgi:putative ABC transport system substrate-binding protein
MRLSSCYRCCRVRRPAISIRVVVLVFLHLFAPASLVAWAAVAVHAQRSQAGSVYRIGFLRAGPPPKTWVEALQQGLREQGYIDGQNLVVEYRFTPGSLDQLPQLAEELVRLKVDVILASSSPAAVAAKKATTSVPIVFVNAYDPVELELVSSLAHPGGNVTGVAGTSADLAGKRLEVLKELVPKLRRVAVLSHPPTPSNPKQLEEAEIAARALAMQVQPVPVRDPADFEAAFKVVRGADGLLLLDFAFFTTHRSRLVALAASSRLPTIYGSREMVEAGGLMSYGVHYPDLNRRAATYVDKILKGAKPGDLPVEQPTKFELVINLKTAKALGLTIPPSLLARADQVIE